MFDWLSAYGRHACKVFFAKDGSLQALGHSSHIPTDPMDVCGECRLNETCTIKADGLVFEAGIAFSIKLPHGEPGGVIDITWACPMCSGETHEDAQNLFTVNSVIEETAKDAICFSCRKKKVA